MLMLNIELMVEKNAEFSITEAAYKGSVFHGLFERALSDASKSLWLDLRRGSNQKARYAIIPPQDTDQRYPAGHRFSLGVMLFGSGVSHWHDVLDALMSSHRLGLGATGTPLVVLSASLHHPHLPAQTHLQAVSARNPAPLWKAPVAISPAAPCERLSIELLSPTQINSQTRRETLLPLTLSSIVKSLQQRLTELEPTLAAEFAFDSTDWQSSVRNFWPHQIAARHTIAARPWFHQSRNTPGPMLKHAIIGGMDFEGAIAAPIVRLLDIGQWLAIGQSCSLGQGWYALQIPGQHPLHPPPLLSPQIPTNKEAP
jgi:hypothetical protein